jgi:hypothetical protein
MAELVLFAEVLELFESRGWRLQKIWEPYRVCYKGRRIVIPDPGSWPESECRVC